MIFDMHDNMHTLTMECKYPLVGKLSTTMPKVQLIRNELDYNTISTLQRMTIEGKLMRIQAWTEFFTPEEETPIVPVGILHP